jgi:membrane protease YdiL (CAAX protease family)
VNRPEKPSTSENNKAPIVPWTVGDTWTGLFLFVLLIASLLVIAIVWRGASFLQSVGLVVSELLYLTPVLYILAKRRISLSTLGFRSFDKNSLALGCGLFVMAYVLIILHNLILTLAGVTTQGEMINALLGRLDNPGWLVFVGIVLAPFVEETFFRGFLFAGFRQRLGWQKSALFTSAIFAVAHLQLVALIPTFILGYLLAYIFHRSNSLWPGIILHFTVNSMAFGLIFVLSQVQ